MFSLGNSRRYLLYNQPCDMRKGFDGLCGLVSNELRLNPLDGGVYIFINRQRNQIKLFCWEPGKHVWQSLRDYRGYLQTDGYSGYSQVAARPDIIHMACLAHIRSKFFEAQNNDKARAQRALQYIGQLYAIEGKCIDLQLSAQERKELRLAEALPIINEMGKWIATENKQVIPKSAIGKAFRYATERWTEMSNYLLDGNLLPDNNLIENQIRPIALGRKNYLFAGSHQAAKRAAIIYTFMAQCKIAGVNPNLWLEHVLKNLQTTKVKELENLLPINFRNKNM